MNNEFITIIRKVISDRGKNIVNNLAVFNSLLADYAKGEYTRERMFFIRELKTKSFDEVMKQYQTTPPKPQPPAVKPPQPAPPKNNAAADFSDDDDDYEDDDDDEDYDEDDEDYEDDDEDDDDEYSRQPVKRDSSQEAYFIKCPRCGENFRIEFFGICRSCHEKTGFNAHRLGTLLMSTGAVILDFLENKPKGIISSISDAIKESHPLGSAAGECSFCKQIHVECPRCRKAVKFPHNKRIDKDVVRCPDCGQWMRHP